MLLKKKKPSVETQQTRKHWCWQIKKSPYDKISVMSTRINTEIQKGNDFEKSAVSVY